MIAWSIALIAVALAGLSIYAIITLRSVRATFGQMTETLKHIESTIDQVGTESVELLKVSRQITENVHGKLEAATAVGQVSAAVSRSLGKHSRKIESNKPSQYDQWVELGSVLFGLWNSYSSRKSSGRRERHDKDEKKS